MVGPLLPPRPPLHCRVAVGDDDEYGALVCDSLKGDRRTGVGLRRWEYESTRGLMLIVVDIKQGDP